MGIKVELDFHTFGLNAVEAQYPSITLTETAGCRCRAMASSHLLVAGTSTSEQARVRSKLVLWLQGD